MSLISFNDCHELAQTRKRKLANNTYLNPRDDGGFGIRLHSTDVVVYYPDRIVLDSGGWKTVTTKDRINCFSPFRVWSERGVWFVSNGRSGNPVPFADGLTYRAEQGFDSETVGEDPKAQNKLRRQASRFSKAYMDAFVRGEVPAPSNGDCWGCLMVATDGTRPMGGSGHMLEHLQENYFVPSMLVNATKRFPMSQVAHWALAEAWGQTPENEPARALFAKLSGRGFFSIGVEQLRKNLRRHVLEELGLPS